eukprot:maker-scaffold449_size167299-snap-gene-0.13 protein:Tk10584 transcript:maker-scaffold449_size167299-snap-gene-0.13-mRNA-1 annotation:"gsh-dependent dehydroascorbate monomeric enzymes catalyzing the reduction of dha into asc"
MGDKQTEEDDDKMELYVKAGPDQKSIGDCPFAHYVRMVIAVKGVDCDVIPLPPSNKPDWLVEDFDGKMPVLDHKGMRTGESGAIAVTLDETFPDPPLQFQGREETAMKTLSGIFPALAKVIKSRNLDFNAEKTLLGQLQVMNSYLIGKPKGAYLLGENISLADCSIVPKLYHLDVTLSHYYPDTRKKLAQFPQLKAYMEQMFKLDAFQNTKYPPAYVIWGWDTARGTVNGAA